MSNKRFYLFSFLVIILFANLVFLDWYFWQNKERLSKGELLPTMTQPSSVAITQSRETSCPLICQQQIDQLQAKVATLTAEAKTEEETAVEKPTPTKISPFAKTIYLPLGGIGSTTNMDWTDANGVQIYFNLSDYSGVKLVTWEAALRVQNGNGQAMARLFDVTHSVAVPGSEISVGTETATTKASAALVIWSGNNLYRVQLKSLTGYEATIDSGRIKVVSE